MAEWQPIETAPRDGTAVIGCWPGFGAGPHVGEMSWRKDWYPLGKKMLELWWVANAGPTAGDPTHWMPLPNPPNRGESQG